MKRRKIIADVLSMFVFIPDSPLILVNLVRTLLKAMFRFIGRVLALVLL